MSGIAGLILAGGLSSRMGRDKAFVPFHGKPLIAHAIDRLRPQVAQFAISVNGDAALFAPFGLTLLRDADERRPGPLAGVCAGLAWAQTAQADALVTSPCDTPFAPRDLVARLLGANGGEAAVAASAAGVEPLFALWPTHCFAAARAALASNDRSIHMLLAQIGAREVEIPVDPDEDWRLNLNTLAEWRAADAREGAARGGPINAGPSLWPTSRDDGCE